MRLGSAGLVRRCGAAGSRLASTSARVQLPPAVDAVVIGGGCVGASVCFHLQERGLTTLLLEAHSLTAGTTWHTAGMLWRLRPSYVDIELHTYTREIAMKLEEAPGSAWTENGGLFIATNKERLAEYERLGQTGEYYGIQSSVVAPSEVQGIHPLMNVEDVYGALHSPTDGTLDPAGLVTAYTRAAKRLGGQVVEGVRVVGIDTEQYAIAGADGSSTTRVTGVRARTTCVTCVCHVTWTCTRVYTHIHTCVHACMHRCVRPAGSM